MKRLFVLRHAKAGPHDAKHDQERSLVDRGRTDSARIGRVMREKNYVPDLVLCSSARRTVETWEHAASAIGAQAATRFLDALYDAAAGTILKCVQNEGGDSRAVVVIGHNPGLEDFARKLMRKPANAEECSRAGALATKFPTCALAVFDFDVDEWTKIATAAGVLIDYVTPANLESQ
jgi:phosphohistidine phosphatase